MKRYIKSYEEPSGYELGKAISEGNKQRNNRFYPFIVSNTFGNKFSANSTGYKIRLDDTYWYADERKTGTFGPRTYVLHGPYSSEQKYSAYVNETSSKDYREFDNLNQVMNYLFATYDVDAE